MKMDILQVNRAFVGLDLEIDSDNICQYSTVVIMVSINHLEC